MFQRGKDTPIVTYGFLVSAELEDGSLTSVHDIASRFVDAVAWMEGVGKVDVESLGPIDVYPGEEDLPLEPEKVANDKAAE